MDKISIYKSGDHNMNVTFHTDCQISVNKTKILDFSVGLDLEIEGIPKTNYLDFILKRHEEFVTFY